jgi:hypothetical protein
MLAYSSISAVVFLVNSSSLNASLTGSFGSLTGSFGSLTGSFGSLTGSFGSLLTLTSCFS